jgi:hypothetical protein
MKGGMSFSEAEDLPLAKKQSIIREINKIHKEMEKSSKSKR